MSVKCKNCPPFSLCERCQYLIQNMARWHKVALHEHLEYCTKNHDHNRAVEIVYQSFEGDA